MYINKGYQLYFPVKMHIKSDEMQGKVSKREMKRIAANEVFDIEAEEKEITNTMKMRSFYFKYIKEQNKTVYEICEFDKPTEKGKFVLPQAVVRNAGVNYPCIVIFKDEGVTLIFNPNGTLHLYLKEKEVNVDEKIGYFSSKFSQYDPVIYADKDIEGYNVKELILTVPLKDIGVNETFGKSGFKGIGLPSINYTATVVTLIALGMGYFAYDYINLKKDLNNKFLNINNSFANVNSNIKGVNGKITQLQNSLKTTDTRISSVAITSSKILSVVTTLQQEGIKGGSEPIIITTPQNSIQQQKDNATDNKTKEEDVAKKKKEFIETANKFMVAYKDINGKLTVFYYPDSENKSFHHTLYISKHKPMVITPDGIYMLKLVGNIIQILDNFNGEKISQIVAVN